MRLSVFGCFRLPVDAREERPVATSPTRRPSSVKIETITPRHVRGRGRARGRENMFQGERVMLVLYHNFPPFCGQEIMNLPPCARAGVLIYYHMFPRRQKRA